MKPRLDKAFWIIALSAGLTLSSFSLVFCPTAHAGGAAAAPPPAAQAPTEAAKHAMELDTDDDGNELLEHWSDPRYSAEERIQLAGMLGAFIVVGTVTGFRRRRALRRACHLG